MGFKFNKLASITSFMMGIVGSYNVHAVDTNWSGLVEIEAGSQIESNNVNESGIALATLELGFERNLTKNSLVSIVLLHEDGDTEPAEIDQATILATNVSGFDFIFGRQYLPFGTFESALVSDPLTLEIGETREAALGISRSINLLTVEGFIFQGEAQPSENNWAPDFMARASVGNDGAVAYGFDIYYINQLANSENMTAAIQDASSINKTVGGAGVAANLAIANLSANAECLSAVQQYNANDYDGRPMACHFETGVTAGLFNKDLTVSAAYGFTRDAQALELPKSRFAAGLSMLLREDMIVAFEWALDNQYDTSADPSQIITAQIAAQF